MRKLIVVTVLCFGALAVAASYKEWSQTQTPTRARPVAGDFTDGGAFSLVDVDAFRAVVCATDTANLLADTCQLHFFYMGPGMTVPAQNEALSTTMYTDGGCAVSPDFEVQVGTGHMLPAASACNTTDGGTVKVSVHGVARKR